MLILKLGEKTVKNVIMVVRDILKSTCSTNKIQAVKTQKLFKGKSVIKFECAAPKNM
jgi:hypothetical protein